MKDSTTPPQDRSTDLRKDLQELQRTDRTIFLIGGILATGIAAVAVCVLFFCDG